MKPQQAILNMYNFTDKYKDKGLVGRNITLFLSSVLGGKSLQYYTILSFKSIFQKTSAED